MREQRDEARGRLHVADTEILRLNGYVSGMQNIAIETDNLGVSNVKSSACLIPLLSHCREVIFEISVADDKVIVPASVLAYLLLGENQRCLVLVKLCK